MNQRFKTLILPSQNKHERSLSDYVVQLKHLSLHCNYAEKLDEHLRDTFISGLQNDMISLKLMEKANDDPTMTFQAAVDVALAREVATGEARATRAGSASAQGRAGPSNTSVHAVYGKHKGSYAKQSSNRERSKYKPCYRCGNHHNPDVCWFKTTKCRNCSKVGHIARVCRTGKDSQSPNNGKQRDKNTKQNYYGSGKTSHKNVRKVDETKQTER